MKLLLIDFVVRLVAARHPDMSSAEVVERAAELLPKRWIRCVDGNAMWLA